MATGTDFGAKIQISSTRKTSNGCSVAKRVSRKNVGWRQPSPNIAAIDFGTTNCSLAYILPGKVPAHGPNMLPFHGTVYRVPTAILFNKDGSVKAFGATARKKYRALEAEQLLEHPYFEQIKMNLQQDEVFIIATIRYSVLCTAAHTLFCYVAITNVVVIMSLPSLRVC